VVRKVANAKLAVISDIVVAEIQRQRPTVIVPPVPLRVSEDILAKQVMDIIDVFNRSLIIVLLFIRTVTW